MPLREFSSGLGAWQVGANWTVRINGGATGMDARPRPAKSPSPATIPARLPAPCHPGSGRGHCQRNVKSIGSSVFHRSASAFRKSPRRAISVDPLRPASQLSAQTKPTVSRVPVASAWRRRLANDGDTRPPSSRATADSVVPSRRASSAYVNLAAARARTSSSMSAYSSSTRAYSSWNSESSMRRAFSSFSFVMSSPLSFALGR